VLHLPTVNVDIQVIVKEIEVIKPIKKNEYFLLIIILHTSTPTIINVSNI
jgi:hypothetical protein